MNATYLIDSRTEDRSLTEIFIGFLLRSCGPYIRYMIGANEEQIMECHNVVHEFLNRAVFQKQSYTGPYNASSDQTAHLPPLFFSNLEVSPSVSATIREILHKASVGNFEDPKCKVSNWERQILQEVMKCPDIRSTSYTVFVSHLPQYQEFKKVQDTKKSSVLKVPFDIEGGFSMEIAIGINGELQTHYNDGIVVVYLVDGNVGLTRITAKDPGGGRQAPEFTQPKEVKKRKKY